MRDIVNNLGVVPALSPAVQAATATGLAVDLKDYNSLMFVVNTGAIAGAGDFTAKVQESDVSGSGYTDAAAADVIGSSLVSPLTADGTFKIGYVGNKRYARLVVTKNSGTSIAAGAVAIKGNARNYPVA
ncbi:MAG: hypothetical protein H0T56_04010 [Pseudaminobacter sp.]|nr:hypothetical protein [Pseudaminobacter sp.]